MFKDFEEFKEKLHPFYGKGNFTKNIELFKFIEENEKKIKDLREELETIPGNKRYSLGSRGVEIINKLHRLCIEKERLEG